MFDFVVPARMVEVRGNRFPSKVAKPPSPKAASRPPSGNDGESPERTVLEIPDRVPLGVVIPVFAALALKGLRQRL